MKRSLLISIILLLLCVILISCGGSTVPDISGKTTDSQTEHTVIEDSQTDKTGPGQSETDPGDTETEPGTPAHSHTVVIDAAVAPTCSDTGLTEGSHCSVCGEIIKAQEVIPATGSHAYDSGICTVCGHQNIVPIYVTYSDGELVAESFCRSNDIDAYNRSLTMDLFFNPLSIDFYEDFIFLNCYDGLPEGYYKFAKQGSVTQVYEYTTDGLQDAYSEISYDTASRTMTEKIYDVAYGRKQLSHMISCTFTEAGQMAEYSILSGSGTVSEKTTFTFSSGKIYCEVFWNNGSELVLDGTHEFQLDAEGRPVYYKNVFNIAQGYTDEFRYIYNEKGNLLLVERKDEDGWYPSYRYEYDSHGVLTAAYEYEDILFSREVEYDREGRVTSVTVFDENGDRVTEIKRGRNGGWLQQQSSTRDLKVFGVLAGTETSYYQYDEFDRLIKEEIHQKYTGVDAENINTINHEYDARGNLTKITYLFQDGTLNWCEEYEHDNLGRRTSLLRYDSDTVIDHYTFEYYDDSTMKTRVMYYPDGTISTKAEYRPDGTESLYTDYNDDGSVNYVIVYDEEGSPASRTRYNRSGEVDYLTLWEDGISMVILSTTYDSSGEVASVTNNEYDEQHRLIRSVSKQYMIDGTFTLREEVYTYHANGSVATEKATDSDGRIINEQRFDENGQTVYYASYDENGILYYGYVVFNGEWYPLIETWYDSDTDTDYRVVYGYDDAGNKTSIHYYLEDGTLDYYIFATYDANGNILTEICYTADDEVYYTCLYSYDSEGRYLEYLEYDENGDEALRQEYSYSGNEATILVYNYGVYKKWVKRIFNENGQVERDIYYHTNDEAYYETIYEYDEDGVLIGKDSHALP